MNTLGREVITLSYQSNCVAIIVTTPCICVCSLWNNWIVATIATNNFKVNNLNLSAKLGHFL